MMPLRIVAALTVAGTALLTTGCAGPSEDELAQQERPEIRRLLPRGTEYSEAKLRLERSGFTCLDGTGMFVGDDGLPRHADHFLNCAKDEFSLWRFASKTTMVIVVPEGDRVGYVQVGVGFTHL
jgi:hypothetical protein